MANGLKYRQASTTPKPPGPKKPQCQQILSLPGRERRRCTRDGVHCWVSGEFGRMLQVLCGPCIKTLRDRGWTVRYQLEGDNPCPIETGK